jgi:hypothetical protein
LLPKRKGAAIRAHEAVFAGKFNHPYRMVLKIPFGNLLP